MPAEVEVCKLRNLASRSVNHTHYPTEVVVMGVIDKCPDINVDDINIGLPPARV